DRRLAGAVGRRHQVTGGDLLHRVLDPLARALLDARAEAVALRPRLVRELHLAVAVDARDVDAAELALALSGRLQHQFARHPLEDGGAAAGPEQEARGQRPARAPRRPGRSRPAGRARRPEPERHEKVARRLAHASISAVVPGGSTVVDSGSSTIA